MLADLRSRFWEVAVKFDYKYRFVDAGILNPDEVGRASTKNRGGPLRHGDKGMLYVDVPNGTVSLVDEAHLDQLTKLLKRKQIPYSVESGIRLQLDINAAYKYLEQALEELQNPYRFRVSANRDRAGTASPFR